MSILYPVFALVLLTFTVLFALGILNVINVRQARLSSQKTIVNGAQPPEYIANISRNLSNLLEVPLLFYIASILALVLSINSILFLSLAWLYVALRLAHTLIHVSYNYVPHRFVVFLLSTLCLMAMWVELAIQTSNIV